MPSPDRRSGTCAATSWPARCGWSPTAPSSGSGSRGSPLRSGYSERHLNRLVTEELGAGLLAIARTQRAHTARILLETTDLPASEVAWAAGFGSIRSFNDTIAAVYGESPTALRARHAAAGSAGTATPRAARRRRPRAGPAGRRPGPARAPTPRSGCDWRPAQPFDAAALLAFLGDRAVVGLEDVGRAAPTGARSALPHGHATVACQATVGGLLAEFRLADLRDLAPAVARVRRLFDLDADPVAVADVLGADPMLAPLVAARPGLRIAGTVDPHEIVVRAIVGQQVSVAGAATVVGRFVAAHGEPLGFADPDLTHVFPSVERLAEADPAGLSMPRARGAALVGVCRALADGELVLDPGVDRSGDRVRTCSPARASGRGPRPTSRCAGSATRTSCWPVTSACATRWRPWAVTTVPREIERTRARVATLALLRGGAPVGQPRADPARPPRRPNAPDSRRPPRRGGPHGR